MTLSRPRIGYARLLLARNIPYYSTIMDSESVINLGHKVNVPLIWPRSELSYGYEPHDLIYLRPAAAVRGGADYRHGREVYPGWG